MALKQFWVHFMSALWPWPWSNNLWSRSWHTLGLRTTIVWNIIQIQHGSEKLWPGHDFGNVFSVTSTLDIWPCVKVTTNPWVMDNNCVKYHTFPTWHWEVMSRTQIMGMYALWSLRYNLVLRSWQTLGQQTTIVWNIIKIQHGSKELWLGHLCTMISTLEIWPMVKVMTHPWVVWNIQIHGSEDLWPGHWFWYVCTLTLKMLLWDRMGQGHVTPYGHGQRLCEVFRSDKG